MYQLDFHVLIDFLPAIQAGLYVTLQISALSIIGGTICGITGALGRTSKNSFFRLLASIYVEWIRNTPLLIQIMFIYFGIGVFFNLPSFLASVLALSLFSGAYITEIIRAGIQAVPKGQREAALSIGMTDRQVLWLVILPQAIKKILPPLAGQFITLIKDSSLVSTIAVAELSYVGKNIVTNTFRAFEMWLAIAFFYFTMTFILSMAVRRLERRLAASD